MGNAFALYFHPEVTPHYNEEPTFDPNIGFDKPREPRVMKATLAELESAKIPLDQRDYCSHLLLEYKACRADVWPLAYKCAHQKHALLNCEYEDYVFRMKEYERERRLRVRRQEEKQ